MSAAQAQDQPEWLRAQQQYWERLFQTQQDQWSNLFTSMQAGVPGAGQFQKSFTDNARQFFDMMQSFSDLGDAGFAPQEIAHDWTRGLGVFFERLKQAADAAQAQQNIYALSENMMKAGHAWASAFSDSRNFGPEGKGMPNFDLLGFFAAMPGIGYTRVRQEELGKLYQLWAAFEKSARRYNAAMTNVTAQAAQEFQAYVANPPEGAPPLTSVRAVYVKWVDICEDIYGRYALTDEYTQMYGETVNALMAFKKHYNHLVENLVSELDLPTRTEIDTLHRRMHDLRREVIQLRQELAGKGMVHSKARAKKPASKKAKAEAKPEAKPETKTQAAKVKPVKKTAGKKPAKKTTPKGKKKK